MTLKIDRVQLDIVINGDESRIELRKLEEQAAKFKKELKGMTEGTEEYIKKTAELRTVQAKMDDIIDKIGITGLTYKELGKRAKELKPILDNLDPNTPEWKKYNAQLTAIDTRMKEIKGTAKETGLSFGKIADGFNKYMGVAAAFIATFSGIVFGARKAVDSFNEFQKSVSNLSALTGLVGDDLNWLADQAKILSVTTTESGVRITSSASEIVEAYKLMGSAKPELLKNKEALAEVTKQALILKEAASIEKTSDAVTALANIMNQFNAPAEQAAKYINVLAAGAKEGAAEIPDLADSIVRSGAAANQANISIEQEVGLIEALAEKGVKGEIAGTGLRNVILDLQKGADDTNPKIVGINTALENLANKNLSATDMMKLFGKENYTVAQLLVTNHQRFNELTKAVTGTSVATEMAAKNTDNNAAKLAQAKNKAELTAIALGEKLAPAFTYSTNVVTLFLRGLVAIIEVFSTYGKYIITATAGIIAYTAAVKIQELWTARATAGTLLNTAITKAKTLADQAQIAVTQLWAAAQMLLTGNIAGATQAMRVFNTVVKANPIGFVVGLLIAAATAFYVFRNKTNEATSSFSDFVTNLRKEQSTMNQLFEVVKKAKEGSEERAKAIKDLNSKYSEYLPYLITEKTKLTEIELAQRMANRALSEGMALKAQQADREKIVTASLEKQKTATIELLDQITKTKGEAASGIAASKLSDYIKQYRELGGVAESIEKVRKGDKTWEDDYRKKLSLLKQFGDQYGLTANEVGDAFVTIVKAQEVEENQLKKNDNLYASFKGNALETAAALKKIGAVQKENKENSNGDDIKELTDYQTQRLNLYRKYVDDKRELDHALTKNEEKELNQQLKANHVVDEERKKNLEKDLKDEEDRYLKARADLKSDYLDGKVADAQTFNDKLEDLETEHVQFQIDINKKANADVGKLEDQMIEIKIRSKEKELKTLKEQDKILAEAQLELAQAEIDNLKDSLQKETEIENLRWEREQYSLKSQLISKIQLSATEIEHNNIVKQTIEEREKAHVDKIKAINDAASIELCQIRVLEAQNDKQSYAARQALAQANYNKEMTAANGNRLKELQAEKKLAAELYAVKKEEIDKEKILVQQKLDNASTALEILSTVVSKETILGKALFAASKAIAIAKIWVETAASNAAIYAQALVEYAALGPGAPAAAAAWSAAPIAANNTSATLNTGLIVAQTIMGLVNQAATGRYPYVTVTGEQDGRNYTVPYITKPTSGYYAKPTLISEYGGETILTADHTRNLVLNYPEIYSAMMAARVPQRAEGAYPVSVQAPATQSNDTAMQAMLVIAGTIERLNAHLDRGLGIDFNMSDFKSKSAEYDSLTEQIKLK